MDELEARRLLGQAQERAAALSTELAQARRHADNLEAALRTNRQIAIAMGIVMARRGVTADTAFDLLRMISQRVHRPIRELADEIVYVGDLPEDVAG